MSKQMKISVIICTFNRSALLKDSILAIQNQDYPSSDYEILVVDNNSTDDTRAITESLATSSPVRIRYVFEGTQGLSSARNAGIKNAEGAIIAFVDDDIDAEKCWLQEIVTAFADPQVACAGGPIRPIWPFQKPDWITEEWEGYLTISEFESAHKTGEFHWPHYPWGANISFRKDVFDTIGMFPTDLGRIGKSLLSNEELNLCKRIEAIDRRIKFVPNAVIHHKIPAERLTKLWFHHRTYYQGKSDAILDAGDFKTKSFRLKAFSSLLSTSHAERKGKEFGSRCYDRLITGYLYQLIGSQFGENAVNDFRRLRTLRTFQSLLLKRSSNLAKPQPHIGQEPDVTKQALDFSALQQKLAIQEQKLVQYERKSVEQQQHIKDIFNSLSWRITSPLRRICDILLQFRKDRD